MVSLELEARLDNLLSIAQEELEGVNLFAPVAEREECPICLIPLPLREKETIFMKCCGKSICTGCIHKHVMANIKKGVPLKGYKCAFCCQSDPKNRIKALKKLMKNNNPQAFIQMATQYEEGRGLLQSDTRSLEMYIRAAELGRAQAYAAIGEYYLSGIAVEQDASKAMVYNEVAAKKGYVIAHSWLASFHSGMGNTQQSIKHLRVAASAGDDKAMDNLMTNYKKKLLSKEDLTQTLRAFQVSRDVMKSKERDDAKAQQMNSM